MKIGLTAFAYRSLNKRLTLLHSDLDRIASVLEAIANDSLPNGYVRAEALKKLSHDDAQLEVTYSDPEEELLREVRESMGQAEEEED